MRLSKIDDKLTIYKNHEIIIFGTGSAGKNIRNMLSSFGIDVIYFCDNNPKAWGQKIQGISVISPEELKTKYSDNYLIQIGSSYESEIEKQLLDMGMENYILYSEAKLRLRNLKRYRFINENPDLYDFYIDNKLALYDRQWGSMILNNIINPIFDYHKAGYFLMLPLKTGDVTVADTAEKYGVYTVNLWHSAFNFTQKIRKVIGDKPIKIITATRDPISQNLSSLYEMMNTICWDNEEYWTNGGDLDSLFKTWVEDIENVITETPFAVIPNESDASASNMGNTKKTDRLAVKYFRRVHSVCYIQRFFETVFQESLDIDIYKYPFDKELGYGIVKAGGMEIFIYQLEKLNQIYPKLFEFLDINDEQAQLVSGNIAAEKWYANYYKEAGKNIQFSKEYFDACYNAPYVKHFYSDEDIEKFKDKWRSRIAPD